MRASSSTTNIDPDDFLRSLTNRRNEADPSAQAVLNEFIRVAKCLSADAGEWHEVVALDESWRDTLSDSEVIRHLRAIRPARAPRKNRRRR